MELIEILKKVQAQRITNAKTSTREPLHDRHKIRYKFIAALYSLCLQTSYGKKELVLDKETNLAITMVCQYINNDPEFEKTEGFSLKKGLWIGGNVGTGKTQLMQVFQYMMKEFNNVQIGFTTCTDMNAKYMEGIPGTQKRLGLVGIKKYANRFDPKAVIFDDLGAEETMVQDFGNRFCVMAHILSERYKGSKHGTMTHVTTNLTKDEILNVYGDRIHSRLHGSFNYIVLGSSKNGTDYRKYN